MCRDEGPGVHGEGGCRFDGAGEGECSGEAVIEVERIDGGWTGGVPGDSRCRCRDHDVIGGGGFGTRVPVGIGGTVEAGAADPLHRDGPVYVVAGVSGGTVDERNGGAEVVAVLDVQIAESLCRRRRDLPLCSGLAGAESELVGG